MNRRLYNQLSAEDKAAFIDSAVEHLTAIAAYLSDTSSGILSKGEMAKKRVDDATDKAAADGRATKGLAGEPPRKRGEAVAFPAVAAPPPAKQPKVEKKPKAAESSAVHEVECAQDVKEMQAFAAAFGFGGGGAFALVRDTDNVNLLFLSPANPSPNYPF